MRRLRVEVGFDNRATISLVETTVELRDVTVQEIADRVRFLREMYPNVEVIFDRRGLGHSVADEILKAAGMEPRSCYPDCIVGVEGHRRSCVASSPKK